MNTYHLDEKQLAERWSISVKTLQAWRLKGGGPRFIKLGRAIRYRLEDIENFESENIQDSTSEVAA